MSAFTLSGRPRRGTAPRRDFAAALESAMDTDSLTMAAVAREVGCSRAAVRLWLVGVLPGGKHGPRLLELFGLDSRDYGANWKDGLGGNYKDAR